MSDSLKIVKVEGNETITQLTAATGTKVNLNLPLKDFKELVQFRKQMPFEKILELKQLELTVFPLRMDEKLWGEIQIELLRDKTFISEVTKYSDILNLIKSSFDELKILPKLLYGGRIEAGFIYLTEQVDFKPRDNKGNSYFHCFSNQDFILRVEVNLKTKTNKVAYLIQENDGHYVYPKHVQNLH